jgi:hypothetical protein
MVIANDSKRLTNATSCDIYREIIMEIIKKSAASQVNFRLKQDIINALDRRVDETGIARADLIGELISSLDRVAEGGWAVDGFLPILNRCRGNIGLPVVSTADSATVDDLKTKVAELEAELKSERAEAKSERLAARLAADRAADEIAFLRSKCDQLTNFIGALGAVGILGLRRAKAEAGRLLLSFNNNPIIDSENFPEN